MYAWFSENFDVICSVVWILLVGYQSHYCFVLDENDEFWCQWDMGAGTIWGFNERKKQQPMNALRIILISFLEDHRL